MNPEVVYSDKTQVIVLDLTRIAQATETDKAYHLDIWAQLFKATTWKGLKAMDSQSAAFAEAVRTILACDQQIIDQYRAAEEYMIHERSQQEKITKLENRLAEMDRQLADKNRQLADLDRQLADLDRQLADKDRQRADLDRQLADVNRQQADTLARIAELEDNPPVNPRPEAL